MPDVRHYERFILPMEPRMVASAWRILRDEDRVQEALQDAVARIWQHRSTLEHHPNPQAWILRIVLNAACDQLRQPKRFRQVTLPSDLAAAASSPEARLQAQELRGRLLLEITRLSPQQREAVLLRLVEELPYADVAAALHCSEPTARVHVERGRKKLSRLLADLHPLAAGNSR